MAAKAASRGELAKPSDGAKELISVLVSDQRYVAECPVCAKAFSLHDANLFYSDNLTPEAERSRAKLKQEIEELEQEYSDLLARIQQGAPKKSLEVILGKVAEKVVPVMQGFPYEIGDCRFLGEPIDYVVFDGLTKSKVNEIFFVDVKTGDAQLNMHQRQIKEAVERGDVSMRLY
jgi:predicted Holliday junction resolvase-like endonuclease